MAKLLSRRAKRDFLPDAGHLDLKSRSDFLDSPGISCGYKPFVASCLFCLDASLIIEHVRSAQPVLYYT